MVPFDHAPSLGAIVMGWKRRNPRLACCAALLGTAVALAGCQPRPTPEQPAQPFVFRSLNLQQRDLVGQLTWSLTSPEARYDLGRKLAQTRNLQGVVFDRGRPKYKLSATSATVLNDGAVIQLEGRIQLQRLGPQPLTVLASRARWYPNEQLIVLDQDPVATQRNLRLSAQRARYLLQSNKLELRDNPLLERQPDAKAPQSDGTLRLQVRSADWFTETGELTSEGPVIGVRQLPNNQGQVLTSPSLKGNSLRQMVSLSAPVRLVDRGRKATLNALETTIDVGQELIASSLPFDGVLNQSQVNGVGFQIFVKRQLAVVSSHCLLKQPTDSLHAERCLWNWSTNEVKARGRVVLKRQANSQITKAERIDGRLGSNGLVVFTSPGGRVNTQLQLKTKPAPGAKATGPGPKSPAAVGPPIQL